MPNPPERRDLRIMRRSGATLADDALVDLVVAAVRAEAHTLRADGSYRRRGFRSPSSADLDARTAAALAGVAEAFGEAARRYAA